MPLILGTNSIKDTGYDVANSLRFDDGSSDYLSSASTGTNGNRKSWTLSLWFKRANLGSTQTLFSAGAGHIVEGFVRINSSDRLEFKNDYQYGGEASPTRVLRDTSAWYHLVWSVDVTQSSNDDRWKIYLNGELIPASEYSSVTINNADGAILTYSGTYASDLAIGRRERTDADYFDGYIAEAVLVEGSQLNATSFGEFDEDSPTIWKPKDVSGLTFGTNGFYLDFENASSLGADVSGNNNDFTVNNLTSIDQTTDTCTNNFATLNPLEAEDNSPTYSDGNLTQTTPGLGGSGGRSSIEIPHTGVWYWEVKIVSTTGAIADHYRLGIATGSTASLGENIRYMSNGQYVIPGSANSYGASYQAGDIIGVKVDADNNQVTFYKNGASQGAISYTMVAGETYKAIVGEHSNGIGGVYSMNFGNPPFSISSGNSDPDGYGNFEYSTDSGYALNTKNLAEYG
jgi:hypothetical protein